MEVAAREMKTSLGGITGASYTEVLAPIELNTSSKELETMPVERRAIIDLLSATVKDKLERWEDFRYQLPQSDFTSNDRSDHPIGSFVSVADLCKGQTDSSELETITMDPDTGDRRRLTPKQCREIFETGRLSFPSQAFPDTNHVWQLASWMMIGRKRIDKNFQKRIGGALDHLLVYCPNRISRKPQEWGGIFFTSVIEELVRIGRSIKSVVAVLVGLPETQPRRTQYFNRANAEMQYVREHCTDCEEGAVNYAGYFDLYWRSMNWRKTASFAYDESNLIAVLNFFKDPSKDEEILNKNTFHFQRRMRRKKEQEEIQRIMHDRNIDDHEKRRILVQCVLACTILDESERRLCERAGSEKKRLVSHALRTHPILCLSKLWFRRWLWKRGAKHVLQWVREQEDENIASMRSQDLHFAALLEEYKIKFNRIIWPEMRKSWLQDRVGTKEYEHIYILFDPYRWLHGGEVSTRTVYTSNAGFGWRFILLWRDMRSFLRSGIYFTIVTNLWRGPIGLRALFSSKDVPFAWKVEGGITRVHKYHYSLQTRIHAIWKRVRELRQEFEDDTGILGKNAMRWLHFIINFGFRGCVSTALVGILQPPITLINLVLTILITVTAILWAPLSAVVAWCFSWLIYDWRSFRLYRMEYVHLRGCTRVCINERYSTSQELFPLPFHLLKALWGVIVIAINGFAILFHVLFAILWIILACGQRSMRIAWEAMWLPFLRHFGRWPARDSFLAKRVQGVGLSETYYHLSTDLVTRCVRARLEQVELKITREAIETAAKRPVVQFKSFLRDVLADLCGHTVVEGTTLSEMVRKENRILQSVNNNFERREKLLVRLTKMPQKREMVRAEKGVAPEEVLRRCQSVVEKFCNERGGEEGFVVRMLWEAFGAEPADMASLTKAVVEDVFSDKFLEPVDAAENAVEVPVAFEKVINVYPSAKIAENV